MYKISGYLIAAFVLAFPSGKSLAAPVEILHCAYEKMPEKSLGKFDIDLMLSGKYPDGSEAEFDRAMDSCGPTEDFGFAEGYNSVRYLMTRATRENIIDKMQSSDILLVNQYYDENKEKLAWVSGGLTEERVSSLKSDFTKLGIPDEKKAHYYAAFYLYCLVVGTQSESDFQTGQVSR